MRPGKEGTMATSLLSSMLGMLDPQIIDKIAAGLGAPGQSVSQGLRTSIAAVLGGLASRSDDPQALRSMLDLNPSGLADTTPSDMVRAAANPGSSLITGGKQILSGLFGRSQTAVTEGVSSAAGIPAGMASTLLSLAAPLVLSFVTKRVRAQGMNMTGLGNLLAQESGAIRSELPASLTELVRPAAAETVSPVVAQTVQAEASPLRWLLPLLVLAVAIPAIFWLANRAPRVALPQIPKPQARDLGTANRVASDADRIAKDSIDTIKGALGDVVLRFDTGSSKLQPGSEANLNHIASTLKAHPDTHVTIEGYTDDVGRAEKNLELSRQRANSVMASLIHKGISADRLSTEGHGQDEPIADNSTAQGRAQNRRVTVEARQH
jgi:OmpA-OmpF porin, OOP family